jgi:hypothetical protein
MKDGRSLVRVKIWLLQLVFLACWLAVGFGELALVYENKAFGLASIISVLMFFVRCEQCHSSEILDGPGRLMFVSWRGVFPAKHCPNCGKERI